MTRANQKEEIIMQTFKTAVLATSLIALAGCSSYIKQPAVCIDRWYGYAQHDQCPAPYTSKDTAAQERQRLADELDAARKQNGALSSRVSDLERS
jgi:chemotaxis protein MotB